MKRFLLPFLLITACILVLPNTASAAWPERPIRFIVHGPVGGGADAFGRVFATGLEKELGVKIIVNNMPGASGGTAAAYVWSQPHDGYTLNSFSEQQLSLPATLGDTTMKDWSFWLAGGGPVVLAVNAKCGITSLDAFLDKARKEPGAIKIALSNQTVGHWQVETLKRHFDLQLTPVLSSGGTTMVLSCVSGEVDATLLPVGELFSYIRAGQLIPLAVTTSASPLSVDGRELSSLTTALPEWKNFMTLQAFQGIRLPADSPAEVQARLGEAFGKVMESPELAEFMRQQLWAPLGLSGQEALTFTLRSESLVSYLMQEMGLAKHSPESLGIEKMQ